jgi:6-phosphogluconolactonase
VDIIVNATAEGAADAAAQRIAAELTSAVTARGRAAIALSGGATPLSMFERLADLPLSWPHIHVFQVDERAVAAADDSRNWLHQQSLAQRVPERNRHPMPVERPDGDLAYSVELTDFVGLPPVFDVVHLGIGDDGHTASLFPGDPALSTFDHDVVWTEEHRGHRRMTLTLPALARARHQVWLVAGAGKAAAVRKLTEPGARIPAAMVAAGAAATLFTDPDAASRLVH